MRLWATLSCLGVRSSPRLLPFFLCSLYHNSFCPACFLNKPQASCRRELALITRNSPIREYAEEPLEVCHCPASPVDLPHGDPRRFQCSLYRRQTLVD